MPIRSALGAVIKARRIELGWTQEDLAERISADGEYVRQSEISRIENGRIALPRRERLERIARALDLSLGELLARSGWAGAEPHFVSSNGETNLTNGSRPTGEDIAIGSDDSRAATDQLPHVLDPERPARVVSSGSKTARYDPDALTALRRALATMQAESDRLQHNRTVASAMQQHFRSSIDDVSERAEEDSYLDTAGW